MMLQIARTTGAVARFDDRAPGAALDEFSGELIAPGAPPYESARRVWNGLIDRHPGLIARCRNEADVARAVRFAREHQLLVSVRGGGHQVAGTAVCEGGLVIDLGLMKRIEVDPVGRLARAEGGVLWGELDRATEAFGLATPGGEVSTTGIAGLTLGGGMGMLQRRYGLSCDNLQSVRVVTADGNACVASEADDPDLFWALRGGGRGLGVVTRFDYRLHPVGPDVMACTVFYPFGQARQVCSRWREFTAGAPDEVTSQLLLWTVPPHPAFPPELHGLRVAIVIGLFAGPAEPGREALRPLASLAEPLLDVSEVTPYVTVQSSLDEVLPAGGRYYWKSLFLERLSPQAIDELLACAAARPSPTTLMVVRHLQGAVGRVPEAATAYANRAAPYNLSLDSIWDDPAADASNIAWTRDTWSRLQRHSTGGVYVNFAGLVEDAEAVARAAHGENYEHLRAIQRQYDPDGVFAPSKPAPV